MGGYWDRRVLGQVTGGHWDGKVPALVMGGYRAGRWRAGSGRRGRSQRCRNARGVAARGGGRDPQAADVRPRLLLARAAAMAGVGDIAPRSSRAAVLGRWQQEDEESFEKINTRPGKVWGTWPGAGLAVPVPRCRSTSAVTSPRSSSSPRPASRDTRERFGVTSPTPRPGSSRTPSPSGSSAAGRGRRRRGDAEGELGWGRHRPWPGWGPPGRHPGFISGRPAAANDRGHEPARCWLMSPPRCAAGGSRWPGRPRPAPCHYPGPGARR